MKKGKGEKIMKVKMKSKRTTRNYETGRKGLRKKKKKKDLVTL
jgi:hypothetical protein